MSCPHCSSRTAPARPAVEIFGRFLRREADTGTDLGLAIAKTFLDAHGQRIWVDNVPRGGATFCFALGIATDLPEEHRKATVLVIDDDTALLAACRVGQRALGHQVRTAATGDAGLSDAAVYPPAVVVLDLGLPDIDGMQVFHQLRGWTQTPVIILSADGSEDRKVEAVNGGADDYVTKPFGMRELDARLRVALRHHATDQAEPITQLDVGPLTLDLLHYEASYRGERIDLTPKEFDFLAYLARHVGKVCTRRMILESIWGPGYINEHHYLKVHAYRIRKKLHDEQGEFLQNDPSVGYRLAVDEADIGR